MPPPPPPPSPDPSDDPTYIDLDLWAKERNLQGSRYPYILHALDATAAALSLWNAFLSPGVRRGIAGGLGVDETHARALVAFWAGCHDIGKLIREFQEQIPVDLSSYPREQPPGDRSGHSFVTHQWLTSALPRFGYPGEDEYVADLVAQLLGGHHGVYPDPLDEYTTHRFAEGPWSEQRERATLLVREAAGSPEPPERLKAAIAPLVCGLVILADWLVSQEHFLPAQLKTPPADGSRPALLAHFHASLPAVTRLVDDAGLRPLTTSPASFVESFPSIDTPNGLQSSLARHLPDLCSDGGLVLITAPPGEGKTEAALHAADLLGAATGHHGRFLALPTMATADQMYGRLREYALRRADVRAPLALLHSMAWLNPEYAPTDEELSEPDGLAPTTWLMKSKRGLLASWSTGTIDQALMAALPARHNAVRMLGLSGKVVIVDEVHAVDPYMQMLLERLLHWLGVYGVPVVLLSATLHHSVANALVKAYVSGSKGKVKRSAPPFVERIAYPGWLHVHPATGEVTANPEPFTTTERHPLKADLVPVPLQDGRPDREQALRELLGPLVAEGGCAAVICTTVAEAQQTRDLLAEWFSGMDPAPELFLLHSRFPQEQRTSITAELTHRLGRKGAAENVRPERAVIVATQVIEQSLDLDLDLLITDLAPIGLLLQRAGRCWRHEHLGIVTRPTWANEPRMAVLVPREEQSRGHLPKSWDYIYTASLLMRTHSLLARRGDRPIRVPEDVQPLVDDLYDDASLIEDVDADIKRIGEELALRTHGRNAVIPTARDLHADLSPLTRSDLPIGEHFLATRFGADSVRVLCCYRDPHGGLWLDAGLTRRLPEVGADGRMDGDDLRAVMARTIPMRATHDTEPPLAEANRVPKGWEDDYHLHDLVLLVHPVDADGRAGEALLGDRRLFLHPDNGLEYRT
ncbi:CRISPR-associated helicase Cas3' [Nocardiopsis sp. NPDC057823]|uniref:CRISPR-associated helicase Cas3' n=1 Tax=Nocardiopsis sp. NPDC057823 TaxID=3346256 RepID=UPI003672B78C